MPITDRNTISKRMWRRFAANCLETLRQSRERQATRVLAENAALLEQARDAAAPRRMPEAPPARREGVDDGLMSAVPKRPGVLLGTIAVMLIALHAICAAIIIDHALAHAPAPTSIGSGD